MIIYTNGCSHSENIHGNYSWANVVSKSLIRDFNYVSWLDIKDFYDFKYKKDALFNFAETSKGNDKIFYDTLEFISQCKSSNIKPDYFIIQWSGPSRFFRYNYNESIELYNPGDDIDDTVKFHFEPIASTITLHYMISLQEIFKNWGVDWYFINYMELDSNLSKHTLNQLDISKCISFSNEHHPLYDGFRNPMRMYGYVRDANGHPSYFGCWYIACKVLKKLDIEPIGFFDSLMVIDPSKKTTSIKDINLYGDFISKKSLKLNWVEIGEGTEKQKNDIRKTLF